MFINMLNYGISPSSNCHWGRQKNSGTECTHKKASRNEAGHTCSRVHDTSTLRLVGEFSLGSELWTNIQNGNKLFVIVDSSEQDRIRVGQEMRIALMDKKSASQSNN